MADKTIKRNAMLSMLAAQNPGVPMPGEPGGAIAEAGVPSGKNAALWATQAMMNPNLPPEFAQMMKYLPMAPAPANGLRGTTDAFKAIMQLIPKVALK